jgi:ATP-dependent Lon protease
MYIHYEARLMANETEKNGELQLPLLPLKDIVVFPHMIVPIFVHEDICLQAIEAGLQQDRKIFLSAFKVPGSEGIGLEGLLQPPFDVYDVGTVCSIMRTRKLPDGRMKVLVQGIQKAKVQRFIPHVEYPLVQLKIMEDPEIELSSSEVEAMLRAVRESLEKVVGLGKVLSPDILMILEDIRDPARLADVVAANLGLKVIEAQKILSAVNPTLRLAKVHAYLSREIEVFQMQMRIQSQAKEEIGKVQREHYLREQIKALRSELGDSGDVKDEIEELWKTLEDTQMPDEARSEITRQLKRLERMHQDTSEASLTRTHIETILSLPWGQQTADNLELDHAEKVLQHDHYGLDKVKDRILEYLAVKKLNPTAKSPILCFVGPPGVGKTSLGQSIAKAMGRKFSRIALGGVRDEADIRGHRKTYVGAFPGRVMQSLKAAGSHNPLIMLDEIDKLGLDHRGDPAAALLEVLDPEQNHTFIDHYLGVAFDLSRVLFIANANTLDTVPPALRDRLEIIEVSGYSEEEKSEIAARFLIPKQIKEAGLVDQNLIFTKSAIHSLICEYTRESGLRTLEKQIASVCRKIARKIAQAERVTPKLTATVIHRLLGSQRYERSASYQDLPAGVAVGMAYTQAGGELLTIETNLVPGNGKLTLTGHLGEVMKESAQTAWSFIRARASQFRIPEKRLREMDIHIHIPQGAVPKEGPSAGIGLTTSMLSALLDKPVAPNCCMTGEISLLGNVLPIGGVREKMLAAQREGMRRVILPARNRAHFLELPMAIRKGIEAIFVEHYMEVFPLLFTSHHLIKAAPTEDPEIDFDIAG